MSHTPTPTATTHCGTALQLTGTSQHAKGHTAKEQKKQSYVLILHRGTRGLSSQAAAEPGSTSSVQVSRTEEGQPDGGTGEPPQPPVLTTTTSTSAMI